MQKSSICGGAKYNRIQAFRDCKILKELDKPKLISKFHSTLFSIGYEFPSPVSSLEIVDVYSYSRELALHKVCEEIDLVNTINRFETIGGGPELGKIVVEMAVSFRMLRCSAGFI